MAKYGYYYSQEQYLFDQNLRSIWFFLLLLIKAILYLPHLTLAYLITSQILDKQNNGLTWIITILIITYIIHLHFLLFQAWIIQLKRSRIRLWIPLFILALLYSSVFPTWILWEALTPYVQELVGVESQWFILGHLFIFLTYFHTHFLQRYIRFKL